MAISIQQQLIYKCSEVNMIIQKFFLQKEKDKQTNSTYQS